MISSQYRSRMLRVRDCILFILHIRAEVERIAMLGRRSKGVRVEGNPASDRVLQ